MRTLLRLALAALLVSSCARSRSRGTPEGGAAASSLERAEVGHDPADARERRGALVTSIEAAGYAKSPRVLAALRQVPRHLFVPSATLAEAYGDWPLPIGQGQTISQPSVVAEMTEALEVGPAHRVLEIGTGSGYQAAILSRVAGEVYTVEIVRELGERAQRRLRDLGYENVHVRIGDGYAGWPERAPFDRVVLTAAPPDIPQTLFDQLADGGVLVAPVGEQGGTQWLVRVRKRGRELSRERIERVRFVPMIRGD